MSHSRPKSPAPCEPSKDEPNPTLRDVYPQVLVSCIILTVFLQVGISIGYSATTLPQMMAGDSALTISDSQASWIASLFPVSVIIGALLCGPPMDLYGRKTMALATCVPLIVGWLFMAFTPDSVWPVYVARVLTGLGAGMTTVSLVYIGELCHQQFRPMVLCLNSVSVSLGVLVTNILGVMLHWRTVALCSAIISLCTFLGVWMYCPESPEWFLNFRPENCEAAKKLFQKLYNNEELSIKEWDNLVKSQQARQLKAKVCKQEPGLWAKLSLPANSTPLLVLMAIFLFQQLSGASVVFFYAVNLFQSIGGGGLSGLSEYSSLILLGLARFAISVITFLASRTIGRRPLMLASGLGMIITSFIATLFFFQRPYEGLFSHQINEQITESGDKFSWVGPVLIVVYVSVSFFGFLIIPWSLVAELLPLAVRGVGSGIIICFSYIVMFSTVKTFPFLLSVISISGAFLIFCFISVFGTIFVYYFLPETLGKSFDEIEKQFELL